VPGAQFKRSDSSPGFEIFLSEVSLVREALEEIGLCSALFHLKRSFNPREEEGDQGKLRVGREEVRGKRGER
jgi:hypothetical protein